MHDNKFLVVEYENSHILIYYFLGSTGTIYKWFLSMKYDKCTIKYPSQKKKEKFK